MLKSIFLDMDGVLVDFVGPTVGLFKTTFEHISARWVRGTYDLCRVLGVDEAELWATIDKHGADHWLNLPAYPWAKTLFDYCNGITHTFVATSPSMMPDCASAKTEWLQKFFGRRFRSYAITPVKRELAAYGKVLIDDFDGNCDDFRDNGGYAIVFPRIWNSMHEQADDPIRYVTDELAKLRD